MKEVVQRKTEIKDQEIDLIELMHLALRKLWLIILCLLVGAVIAGGYTKLLITPQYSATSTIYILTKTTSVTSMADIQLGSQLTADFIEIAKSRPVVEGVIEKSGLDMTYGELAAHLSAVNPTSTHLLKLSVTDSNPENAEKLANAYADVMADQVANIMNTDRPNIAERAIEPVVPSSPNLKKNILIGGLLGAAAALAVILMMYLMNDTIQTEEDVQKYLGLHTLAAMPLEKRRKA